LNHSLATFADRHVGDVASEAGTSDAFRMEDEHDSESKDDSLHEQQIGCRLSKQEAWSLDWLAKRHGVSRPDLCIMLVQRALNGGRLAQLGDIYSRVQVRAGGARVTARTYRADVKEGFAAAARAADLLSDEAAAVVFRAEIEEKWICAAMCEMESCLIPGAPEDSLN
jgi:hypothetical protein